MTTAPVFLVEALPTEEHTVLDGAEGRHAATVRRLRTGEKLVLTDGAGATAECAVAAVGKQELELTVLRRDFEPAPEPQVVLVQALVKGDGGELAVELATEAGVDKIVPWSAARCIARWDAGPRGAKALGRWRSTASSAAKQARRCWLPPVTEPVGLSGLADMVRLAELTLVLHESAQTPLPAVNLPPRGRILLVVGPEGGITTDELETLTEAGAQSVRIGHTVLRASAAGAIALGAIGALSQRWQH